MKKILLFILSFVLILNLLTGCSKDIPVSQQGSLPPVTIENFNNTTTYTIVPERVVVLSYDVAEIMTALGLEDKIVGLATAESSLDDVLPQYRDKISKIPTLEGLNNGIPNLESVLKVNPDFVYAASYSFHPQNAGIAEDYEKNGVNIYASEGTYVDGSKLENTYNDIINIGKIFRVESHANKLIAELKTKENSIKEKTSALEPVKVFVYDSGESTPCTTGGTGLENNLITLAGGKNIFSDINKQLVDVTWEDLIDRNPEVIIIHKWDTTDDAEQKISFLKSKKELSEIPAIKNNRFIVVPLLSVFPSLQNMNALETIANGLHPDKF